MRKLETVRFSSDGYTLKGYLHLPPDNPAYPPVVVGSHGLFSTANSPKQTALARSCNNLGIAFFRFDHRGCGESEGSFSRVTSLESRSLDLISAVRKIITLTGSDKAIGLFGSSLGGATCLNIARRLPVKAVVSYAAPVRLNITVGPADLPIEIRQSDPQATPVVLQFDISRQIEGICSVLLVHGEADPVIPCSDAIKLYHRIGSPKRLILQRDGDHPMSRKNHQTNFIVAAAKWFETHLPARYSIETANA